MRYLLLLGLLHAVIDTSAQFYFYNDKYWERPWLIEAGLSFGGMNCFTDIGGRKGNGGTFIKDLNLVNTALCGGVYLEASYNYTLGFRIESFLGKVKAYDSVLKNDHSSAQQRYFRNLHFQSKIRELSFLIEFYPVNLFSKKDEEKISLFSPYVLTGIAFFQFNPQAVYEGNWVDLHPLRTEGQGFRQYPDRIDYRLSQAAVPLGLGLRYEASALLNLKLELVHRLLFTDYLDDVSKNYVDQAAFDANLKPEESRVAKKLADRRPELNPSFIGKEGEKRGNSLNNDSYFSLSLKLGIILNRKRRN